MAVTMQFVITVQVKHFYTRWLLSSTYPLRTLTFEKPFFLRFTFSLNPKTSKVIVLLIY